jgi:formamidopyrimidine-DNA glycosylase
MPELPEVEITAGLLDRALAGATIESALAPGINVLRTFDPALERLAGGSLVHVGRRGKLFVVQLTAADGEPLAAVIHLMSAGRLQLYGKLASPRDRTSRLLLRLDSERELRLREFGSKQAAWVKLLREADLETEPVLSALGPEAWPEPPAVKALQQLLGSARPLYTLLRDQHVIAGIGRSWGDEILHAAQLSPFKRGSDLSGTEVEALRAAIATTLGGAVDCYERTLSLPLPDKLPLPLSVHRHAGEPCPRCGTTIASISFEDYVLCYCPTCQTGGRVLKDRRLSRLLK